MREISTGEKHFSCEICTKTYRHSTSLKIHKKTHTDEKPHSCQYCKRKFRSLPASQKHEKIHTDEKPFFCEKCPFTAKHRKSIGRHKLTCKK